MPANQEERREALQKTGAPAEGRRAYLSRSGAPVSVPVPGQRLPYPYRKEAVAHHGYTPPIRRIGQEKLDSTRSRKRYSAPYAVPASSQLGRSHTLRYLCPILLSRARLLVERLWPHRPTRSPKAVAE